MSLCCNSDTLGEVPREAFTPGEKFTSSVSGGDDDDDEFEEEEMVVDGILAPSKGVPDINLWSRLVLRDTVPPREERSMILS